jgi:circadian clock protein KaiB
MTKAKLTLFVAGSSSRTTQAIENLRLLCEGCEGEIEFEIVDILDHPHMAERERVFATPMLVKSEPLPRRRIIGDLADRSLIKQRLDLSI